MDASRQALLCFAYAARGGNTNNGKLILQSSQVKAEVSASPANYDRSHQTAGSPFPRGASWDGQGVNFSLFSESSESVNFAC